MSAKKLAKGTQPRPGPEAYRMALAVEVASRSNCLKAHVGAILLLKDRIVAAGYNGTVEGFEDCLDGGCPRCRDLTIGQGKDLDRCVCVHAEENALVSAARFGIAVEGAECYVTHEPCLGCTKLLIQARVSNVVFLKTYSYDDRSDHNTSREAMRSKKRSPKVLFRQFDPNFASKPMMRGWLDRLAKMKEEAWEYGQKRGVVISGETS